jgi:hypothetical protein
MRIGSREIETPVPLWFGYIDSDWPNPKLVSHILFKMITQLSNSRHHIFPFSIWWRCSNLYFSKMAFFSFILVRILAYSSLEIWQQHMGIMIKAMRILAMMIPVTASSVRNSDIFYIIMPPECGILNKIAITNINGNRYQISFTKSHSN